MNNVRFATALHILTLLALKKEALLSSEYIAGSININPAIVRKEISNLREHGFVESKEGKGGGSTLARAPKKIRLSEIYIAVNQAPILGRSNNPNPACEVGREINQHLNDLYIEAEQALIKKLDQSTLADFTNKFI